MAGRKKKTTHSSGLLRKRITVGHGDNGKPIIKTLYAHTQPEMDEKVGTTRINAGLGAIPTNNRTTFKYWSTVWRQLRSAKWEKNTADMYGTTLKHLSVFNEKKISQISSLDIEVFLTGKFREGYAKRTISLMRCTASSIFNLARKNHAVLINPVEDTAVPKEAPTAEREAVLPEVQEKLWSLRPIGSDKPAERERGQKLLFIRMFALTQLECGPRREEVAALKWRDIDLKAGTLSIARALNFRTGKIKSTKTASGVRTVPIPDRFIPELQAWKDAHADTLAGRTWVFPYHDKLLTSTEFLGLWNILLDGLNGISLSDRIKDGLLVSKKARGENPKAERKPKGRRHRMYHAIYFTSHQLRHTYATNANDAGIDVRTLQALMGHANAAQTLKYTHLSPNSLAAAREKMNQRAVAQAHPPADGSVQSGH